MSSAATKRCFSGSSPGRRTISAGSGVARRGGRRRVLRRLRARSRADPPPARSSGYDLQLVTGDGVVTDDFWLIAGPAAEGTLSTSFAEPVDRPGVQELVAAFRAGGYEPVGNTLHTYAAVQAWAQAVAVAGTTDADAVMEVLRSHDFETVLGTVGFDDRGEVYGYEPFAWYVWRAGKYLLAETPAR